MKATLSARFLVFGVTGSSEWRNREEYGHPSCNVKLNYIRNNRTQVPRVTLYTAGHLHTVVPHCSHSHAPIVHTAVPRENNEHGCVYLRYTAVCKLPGCVEGHPWVLRDISYNVVRAMGRNAIHSSCDCWMTKECLWFYAIWFLYCEQAGQYDLCACSDAYISLSSDIPALPQHCNIVVPTAIYQWHYLLVTCYRKVLSKSSLISRKL